MTKKVNITLLDATTQEDAMVAAVAQRIAALRANRKYTFDEFARRSGVSKGTLVQIEQERANPSISTLCRLATALGVSVADLVSSTPEAPSAVTLVRGADTRQLWTGPRGGSAVLLAGTTGPDMLEMWRWELQPGERFEATRHNRSTRELIHVLAGRLTLEVEGKVTIIPVGVTAIAHTDRPHAYSNSGKSLVRFFMTVHEPAKAP
jgi:transcriptional regulator with XRE-family HTH domain